MKYEINREVLTTSGSYPWSFVTHMFVCHFVHFHMTIVLSVLLRFTNSDPLVSSNYSVAVNQVVCSPAAIFYQENPKMMVLLTWLCELHVQVLLECCYKWMRNLQLKTWNHIVCRTIWIKIEIKRMTCLNIRLVISMLTIFIIETQLEF